MTDKIMELARNFRYADLRQVESTRRALEAAIKAEQDYTRAVISERDSLQKEVYALSPVHRLCVRLTGERDAWKESADEQVALLMKTANERDELGRWKSTNAPRIRALEGLQAHYQKEAAKGAEAIASLQSEREANAILTDERDAFCTEADVLRMSLTAMQSERDKLTMVHAERTVERDRLRKAAQMALEALVLWGIAGHTSAGYQYIDRAKEALLKELGHV